MDLEKEKMREEIDSLREQVKEIDTLKEQFEEKMQKSED